MAVTLSAEQLAEAMRIDLPPRPDPLASQVDRLLAFASVAVVDVAPAAPDRIHDEAAIRLAGWIYDAEFAGRSWRSPMRQSGAWALLASYRGRRVVETGRAFSSAFGGGFR